MTEILTKLFQFIPNFFYFLFGEKEKKIEQEYLLKKAELETESVLNRHDFENKKLETECSEIWDRQRNEGLTQSEVLNIRDEKYSELREKQMIEESKVKNNEIYHQKLLNKYLGVVGRVCKWHSERRMKKY